MLESLHLALAGTALLFIESPRISPWGEDLALQPFGMIVVAGVLIGAIIMRRYTERHGIDNDDRRGLIMWLVICGFIGAHVFNVLAYQWDELKRAPLLLLQPWKGISSYGGFIGGAAGNMLYVWRKRLNFALFADASIVGLLPAFSIGRIACTLVSDHPGRPTDFFLGFDYPLSFVQQHGFDQAMRLHNLGFYELLYLIPVNALILWLAFRKRLPAGVLAVLAAALYAPVRFLLDFLRLPDTDPRHAGLTFAQWGSIVALVAVAIAAARLIKTARVAPLASEPGGKPGGRTVVAPCADKNSGSRPGA